MRTYLYLILLSFNMSSHADKINFVSNETRTPLIELYSSQGCSSCPPAERWFSKLKTHPDLWHKFIPVVFHVDYWNYLGWVDPYSDKRFSHRQRIYHYQGATKSVYTPGIIYDGQEWREWYRNVQPPYSINRAGVLSAVIHDNKLKVNYLSNHTLQLNIALLGFELESNVTSGENKGRNFTEDFIVLNYTSALSDNGEWQLNIIKHDKYNAKRYAIAIWVNDPDKLLPLQAVGGWLH